MIEKRTEDSFIKSPGQLTLGIATLVMSMFTVLYESLDKGYVSRMPIERDIAIMSSMSYFYFRIDANYL